MSIFHKHEYEEIGRYYVLDEYTDGYKLENYEIRYYKVKRCKLCNKIIHDIVFIESTRVFTNYLSYAREAEKLGYASYKDYILK